MELQVFERRLFNTEKEKASNAYLMSLVGLMAGLPLPIINLVASVGYYWSVRNSTAFVKFHAFQAMTSQFLVVAINAIGLSWTLSILFSDGSFSAAWAGWMAVLLFVNVTEWIGNIIGAIQARKGKLYGMYIFGPLAWMVYGSALQKQEEALRDAR
jgi:uncharacterized membrane protein